MDLVTVTCNLDRYQMIQQAESIKLFVEPCTHWVIINERSPDLAEWYALLSPYYTNHKLNLKTYDHSVWPMLNINFDGYYFQQIFKILISKDIQDDYLLLDSKNLFIKPLNTEYFRNQTGDGLNFNFNEHHHLQEHLDTIKYYSVMLDVDFDTMHLNPLLPFTINYNLMNKIDNLEEILLRFSNSYKHVLMSEFLLYSVFCKKHNYPVIPRNHQYTIKYLWRDEEFTVDENLSIIGLHRRWVANSTSETLYKVNSWMQSLGFTNLFKNDH